MGNITLSEALRNYMNSGSMIIGGGINMFGEEYAMRRGTQDVHKRIKEYFDKKKEMLLCLEKSMQTESRLQTMKN